MVSSRIVTAIAGLGISVLISVVAWLVFDTLLLFLFVPFVPLLLRGAGSASPDREARQCPTCGFKSADPAFEFCPRDGTRLE